MYIYSCIGFVLICIVVVILFIHNDRMIMYQKQCLTNTNNIQHFTNTHRHTPSTPSDYPCRTKLTDKEYLKHMIPHHQVAVDVSVQHLTRTHNDVLANVLRTLIFTQQYEIQLMQTALRTPVAPVSDIQRPNETVQRTTFSSTYPNVIGLSETVCNPHFFDPIAHRTHMNMIVTDKAYIDHMIPHHQVAVDMSKRLLRHTQSDFMTYLAYRIIRSQEAEIKLLYDLKK